MTTAEIYQFLSEIDINEFISFFKLHSTQTILEKYQIPSKKALNHIKAILNIKLTDEELKIKNANSVRESCQRKYGVDNPGQLTEIKAKIRQNNIIKYGTPCTLHADGIKDKVTQTWLKKYGVKHVLQNKEIQEKAQLKARATCIKKYGVPFASQTVEVRKKRYEALKRNGTFVTSKYESWFYNLLLTKYTSNNIIRQYKEARYPFACDFYIKSEDLFIELNICWTHGFHPFDETNLLDQQQLEIWYEKAKTSKFYLNAIDTWTNRDLIKFKVAQENNLNYLTFYSQEEALSWFNSL